MSVEPYSNAQRVFVIVDNGSAHRQGIDQAAAGHVAEPHPRPYPDPRQLAQPAEIYFSIVQRKLLTPNDFPDLDTLQQRLLAFSRRYDRSPPHSNGSSPAPTSTSSPTDSTNEPPDTRIRRRTSEPEHF